MNGAVKNLIAELERQPATLAELAARLQYPVHRVLGFITQARVAGVPIQAVGTPGELTVFEVRQDSKLRTSETIDPSSVMEDNRE